MSPAPSGSPGRSGPSGPSGPSGSRASNASPAGTGASGAATIAPPGRAELDAVFRLKYGDPDAAAIGWGPRARWRAGNFQPDDWYEAVVAALVQPGTAWLDVGCGRHLFPSNAPLAEQLGARAGRLVGVDPDPTLDENPYVHERVRRTIDGYTPQVPFDVVTLRMVAEHVADPAATIAALARCTRPGGVAVVYTVYRWSPVPLATSLVPFRLRHPVKRFLWRTQAKDTFPTCFRMNSRRTLRRLFAHGGFDEALFLRLDDCRTFGRFRWLNALELRARTLLRALGLPYPEACLLGVYRRR